MIIDKKYVLDYMHDIAIDFLHYNRGNDEELTEELLYEMLDNEEITIDEIVESFRKYLNEMYNEV